MKIVWNKLKLYMIKTMNCEKIDNYCRIISQEQIINLMINDLLINEIINTMISKDVPHDFREARFLNHHI